MAYHNTPSVSVVKCSRVNFPVHSWRWQCRPPVDTLLSIWSTHGKNCLRNHTPWISLAHTHTHAHLKPLKSLQAKILWRSSVEERGGWAFTSYRGGKGRLLGCWWLRLSLEKSWVIKTCLKLTKVVWRELEVSQSSVLMVGQRVMSNFNLTHLQPVCTAFALSHEVAFRHVETWCNLGKMLFNVEG